jgi:hypothetical protein
VAVVGVPSAAAAVTLPILLVYCELVMFQPEPPIPLNDVLATVEVGVTVLVRVMWVVSVRSGPTNVVEVDVSADGVMVVVWVRVVCDVVFNVLNGSGVSLGVMNTVVVAVVSNAPLLGETPLIQLVVPESTEKT